MESFLSSVSKSFQPIRSRLSPTHVNSLGEASQPIQRKSKSGVSHHPTDRLYHKVAQSSTPATSPTASHDIESSVHEVEEITSRSQSKTRPSSTDSLDDGRPIPERIQDVRALISKIEQLKHDANYLSVVPPLHAELVDKVNKLLDFTALSDLQSLYRPELLDYVETAARIRTTFSHAVTQDGPPPRRRSSSEGDNGLSPPINTSAVTYSSRFAQRLSMANEPSREVFLSMDLPRAPQPGASASEIPPNDRSFSAEQHFTMSLDAVFDRI